MKISKKDWKNKHKNIENCWVKKRILKKNTWKKSIQDMSEKAKKDKEFQKLPWGK